MYQHPQNIMPAIQSQGMSPIASKDYAPQADYRQIIHHEQPNAYEPSAPTIGGGYLPISQVMPSQDNCPSELYNLLTVDKLIITRQAGSFEGLTGFNANKKYTIRDGVGQTIYYAVEEIGCCAQSCYGVSRGFEMKILNQRGNEVIHLSKPCTCQSCLFPCSSEKIEIFLPTGCLVGSVKKQWSVFRTIYTVCNELGKEMLKIKKPFGVDRSVAEFKVFSKENVQIGRTSRQLSGLPKEFFPDTLGDSRCSGITFPREHEVTLKAIAMGACFLIIS